MNRSDNYNLYLPESSDYRDVSQLTWNFETLDDVVATRTNYKTVQQNAFNQLDSSGGGSSSGISSIPTTPGVYRVTSVITGLPTGSNGYGTMLVFNGGGYLLYVYVDASMDFYYCRTASVAAPSTWYKLTGTAVNATT